MTTDPQESEKKAQPDSVELIQALNAIALALQKSVGNEENVYTVFQEQVIALGLRGGISELDERGETLNFRNIAISNPLRKILGRFERRGKTPAEGYTIRVNKVDVYQKVTQEGQSIFVPDTTVLASQVVSNWIKPLAKPVLAFLGSPPGIFTPLIYDGKIKGMLNMVGSSLTAEDVPTMRAFANQIAVALENARLVRKLKTANEELETAYQKTLEGWVQALDLRDNETEGHTLRTAELTVHLARLMGVPEADLPNLCRGALLHDIGKMAIPDNILKKPGPLTEAEWQIMRQHPQTAFSWLSSIDYLKPALVIPYCHHERWDGNGYVQGLVGEQIPLWARIFSVIDAWDAMRSDRPYRKAFPEAETRQFIRQESGKKFDPQVVEAFLDLLARYPELAAKKR
jgi:putative nucleotidyltransferase with HDIG domain